MLAEQGSQTISMDRILQARRLHHCLPRILLLSLRLLSLETCSLAGEDQWIWGFSTVAQSGPYSRDLVMGR